MKAITKFLAGGVAIAALAGAAPAAAQYYPGYGYPGYGYPGYGGGIGIQSVEIRSNGGYKVRGVASGVQFTCRTDPRGFVTDVDVNNGYYGQGYGNPYYGSGYNNPYNPYAVYGYQRY